MMHVQAILCACVYAMLHMKMLIFMFCTLVCLRIFFFFKFFKFPIIIMKT